MHSVTRQFVAALGIVEKLQAKGYEAYLAGGCVRDLLLGREPSDYDVATSATPDVVLGMFERTFAVGAHFGVVLVADGDEAGYVTSEVATFRSDGAYSDGRHPDAVRYTKSAEEDVKRRDFTMNGLLLDPRDFSLRGKSAPAQRTLMYELKPVRLQRLEYEVRVDTAIEAHNLRPAVRILWVGWLTWTRGSCGQLGRRSCDLRKIVCGCCAGYGLRRGSGLSLSGDGGGDSRAGCEDSFSEQGTDAGRTDQGC